MYHGHVKIHDQHYGNRLFFFVNAPCSQKIAVFYYIKNVGHVGLAPLLVTILAPILNLYSCGFTGLR